ncbi:ADP-ribosylation factor-binding protein GGA1-like [Sinocyclocheilus grahami]|uniref:ADP-ribosylation factor-binding protein GGA1-like n=1 Tax=Sinocyclocheilus grahami TaxID=75366 RepID=UPI0007AD37E8|nr:PREDICTED: ADP-ribosylation factor-binding protein GGA1-like [Sinocyclocheilus grahami]
MAAPPDEQSLESRINKATNPLNRETDWESIQLFCDQLSNEPEGPQLATRLLAHKIQSPQEWEAMQALMVLETCVKNCGKRFHNEVGKFRFLNELIKVVSPKYLGSRAPEPVKKKVLEVMYSWTVCLPEETKISDAYQMLKKQGIIKQDPDLPDDKLCPPPLPRPKNAIFEDEEKSKMLSRLLNSSHPEDLRAANKLIKEMVQEDQKRMEKVSKRVNAIQEVKESVGLLTQLLGDYSKESGSHSTEELIKDLYQRCEKMRPTLFRLASDTEDNDEALDSLSVVIAYMCDLTLSCLFVTVSGLTEVNSNLATSQPGDDMTWNTFQSSESVDAAVMPAPAVLLPEASATKTLVTVPVTSTNSLDELDLLGKTLLQQSLPPESLQVKWDKLQSQSKPTLRDLQIKSGTNTATTPSPVLTFSSEPGTLLNSQLPTGITPASAPQDDISLVNVTVPLESIKPSSLLPVTIFDKHSLRVLFHFARDSPPARPDVLVVIISMLSSAPVPITNVRFQAAVPKTMRVKLQPPSGSDLPAFNPLLPPAAITQVLLLANPHKENVQLRYKLTFDLGQESHDESGDVEQFPPPESWGNL